MRHPLRRLLDDANKRSPGPQAWDDLWDVRRRLVRELAPGRSFLDVGGMFGVDGELAFLAEASGATKVVLFDAMDPTPAFEAMHRDRGSALQFFQGDLHDASIVDELGRFDVVWCSGVIYHSPHPLLQLQLLRRLTIETVVVGSLVLPDLPGFEQACILYPGTSAATRQAFADAFGGAERFPGMATPFDETPLMAYVNMWWGITPSALRSMLWFAGFQPVEAHQHTPFALDIVARVGGAPTEIYPPLDQSRGRVHDRLAGKDVPAYAEAQWRLLSGEVDPSPPPTTTSA